MKNPTFRGAILFATALLTACGPFQRGGNDNEAALIFENASIDQAAVYAVMPGSDMIRLGTVLPGQTDTLSIPASVTGRNASVSIVARMLGANSFPQTGPLNIGRGDAFHVRLSNNSTILTATPVDIDGR
jgi:hypothetical protein